MDCFFLYVCMKLFHIDRLRCSTCDLTFSKSIKAFTLQEGENCVLRYWFGYKPVSPIIILDWRYTLFGTRVWSMMNVFCKKMVPLLLFPELYFELCCNGIHHQQFARYKSMSQQYFFGEYCTSCCCGTSWYGICCNIYILCNPVFYIESDTVASQQLKFLHIFQYKILR